MDDEGTDGNAWTITLFGMRKNIASFPGHIPRLSRTTKPYSKGKVKYGNATSYMIYLASRSVLSQKGSTDFSLIVQFSSLHILFSCQVPVRRAGFPSCSRSLGEKDALLPSFVFLDLSSALKASCWRCRMLLKYIFSWVFTPIRFLSVLIVREELCSSFSNPTSSSPSRPSVIFVSMHACVDETLQDLWRKGWSCFASIGCEEIVSKGTNDILYSLRPH